MIRFGREIAGELDLAERREWLCTNGLGGFASGTVAGTLPRRYHGLLVAAREPPPRRTLLVPKGNETIGYDRLTRPPGADPWAGGAGDPHGDRDIQRFAPGGASPLLLLAQGAAAQPAHTWYRNFDLPRERERGLEATEDHLHAGTFATTLASGEALTLVLSVEAAPSVDGAAAWRRRARHEAELLAVWRRARPEASRAPAWIGQLVLAADQFVARRRLAEDAEGTTVVAGYHWFGDWGRDTMIALPGLTLVTGRPDVTRRVLATFARFVDRG